MDNVTITFASYSLLCAVVAGKWGLEYGVSQFRQILLMIDAALFGPVALLIQYLYFIRRYEKEGSAGGGWFRSGSGSNQ